jgi:hypothetical protein
MKKLNLSSLLIIALSILFLSCGREDIPGASIEKISNPDKTFSIEDFEAIGLKKNKTYKVSDLPKATSAYYGFLKIKGTKQTNDYELRFYDSQVEALNPGVEWVEERIGKGAVLTKGDARWKEGVREARTCGGDSGHGKGYSLVVASSTCNLAKYFDYFVYGNVILLCQGKDIELSTTSCRLLLSKLETVPE